MKSFLLRWTIVLLPAMVRRHHCQLPLSSAPSWSFRRSRLKHVLPAGPTKQQFHIDACFQRCPVDREQRQRKKICLLCTLQRKRKEEEGKKDRCWHYKLYRKDRNTEKSDVQGECVGNRSRKNQCECWNIVKKLLSTLGNKPMTSVALGEHSIPTPPLWLMPVFLCKKI